MTDLTVDEILTVTAAAAVVVCGLLPWYALSASGLTGLDDQVLAGRPGRRDRVLATVDGAYRSLSWAAVAVALPARACRRRWLVRSASRLGGGPGRGRHRARRTPDPRLPADRAAASSGLAAIGATLVAVLALAAEGRARPASPGC